VIVHLRPTPAAEAAIGREYFAGDTADEAASGREDVSGAG
jgi:hypothetical protein